MKGLLKPQSKDPDERREIEQTLWAAYKESPTEDQPFLELLEFYLPLVIKLVRRICIQTGYQIQPEELLSTGVLGLHEAVRRYDAKLNDNFRAFAALRIRGAVLDELRKIDPLSRRQRNLTKQLHKLEHQLTADLGRHPTHAELAVKLDVDETEVDELLDESHHTVSLNNEAGEGLEYIDTIESNSWLGPDESADYSSRKELMKMALKKLSPKEQQLLYFRHYQELSVKEIAAVFEVSPGRVSQMYNEAMSNLRRMIDKLDQSR